MNLHEPIARRVRGQPLPSLRFETLAHGPLQLPTGGPVHLQFRRFAGCPVCNLHLRSFTRAFDRISAAGLLTVAFFHSSAESMRPYQGDLPFPAVPDPERRWYDFFGVEQATFAVARPQVMWSALKGLALARSNPFAGEGGQRGLPADFLLGPDGRLVDLHYGAHADDQWSVDDVLERVAGMR